MSRLVTGSQGHLLLKTGRDGEIRTRDPLNPIQVRYQAAPRPDPALVPPILARRHVGVEADSPLWVESAQGEIMNHFSSPEKG